MTGTLQNIQAQHGISSFRFGLDFEYSVSQERDTTVSHFEMVIQWGFFFRILFSIMLMPIWSFALPVEQREPASINRAALMVATPSKIFYGENGKALSPEMITTFHQVKTRDQTLDISQIIPMDLVPTQDANLVLTQVADRSFSAFWNSEVVQSSSVAQAATVVEQKMKQEVVIGGGDPRSVQHKFNFNLQAFQALAQIEYSGFTHAALRYKVAESTLALEIFEKLSDNRDVVLSHTTGPESRSSNLSFRWNF
jgi:hypothetical protein